MVQTLTNPITDLSWNFPIELQDLKTTSGAVAPRTKAIVRTDTNEVLSAVSTRYKPVLYEDIIRKARIFTSSFGKPTERVLVGRNGASMNAEYTYMDRQLAVAKGDALGLRVYIGNSYNTSSAVTVRIGCIVLSCLNGMVADKSLFEFSWRHTQGSDIRFPDPSLLLSKYTDLGGMVDTYSESPLDNRQLAFALTELTPLIGTTSVETVCDKVVQLKTPTVWDFMQASTYEITHRREKANYLYKLNKLSKVDKIVGKVYRHEYGGSHEIASSRVTGEVHIHEGGVSNPITTVN